MRSATRSLLTLVAAFFVLGATTARADYMLPEAKERYLFVADDWTLDGKSLTVTRGEVKRTLSIDTFWLADRIDSNSICCGGHEKKMAEYLDGLKKLKSPLLVEVVTTKKEGDLFIAGLWKLDFAESFKKASEHGSPALGLDAEKVKALGGAKEYEKAMREKADADWKKIEARPVQCEKPVSPAK